jgi:hypothetical protein
MRIDVYLGGGRRGQLELDTRYESLHREGGYALVREIGAYARAQLFADNYRFCVFYRGESPPGAYRYSVLKMDPFVPVDLPAMFESLNQLEGIAESSTDRWGGGGARGGSPRDAGSKFGPDQLHEIVKETLTAHAWPADEHVPTILSLVRSPYDTTGKRIR